MSSPRSRNTPLFLPNPLTHKSNHYQSYDSSRQNNPTSYLPPSYDQPYRTEGCYTSPHSRKNPPIPTYSKSNRFQRIKSLKGMVNDMIEDKKINARNTAKELGTLSGYQREIMEQFYEVGRMERVLGENTVITPRGYQSQKYRQDKRVRFDGNYNRYNQTQNYNQYPNPPRPQNNPINTTAIKYSNNKDAATFNKKFRTEKNQQKPVESNLLPKPSHFKPSHKRKQSSELYIQRPYSAKEQNDILREENSNLKQELKKSKAYVKLLEREIRELNEYIRNIEDGNRERDTQVESSSRLKQQIFHLNKTIKELSEIKQKGVKKQPEDTVELRLQLKGFKQENEYLRKNMMKLLNSKLQSVPSPHKNPKKNPINVSPAEFTYPTESHSHKTNNIQLQDPNKRKPKSKSKQKYKAQQSSHNNSIQTRIKMKNTPETKKPYQDPIEETNLKSNAESVLYQMATLLSEHNDKDPLSPIHNPRISHFQY